MSATSTLRSARGRGFRNLYNFLLLFLFLRSTRGARGLTKIDCRSLRGVSCRSKQLF
jgi:hypothetical protein